MSFCRQRAAAFTLIEVMIVVGLLGIVLAMGAPSFVQMVRRDPLRQAAVDLMEGCAEARAQAILSGRGALLVLRAGDGEIRVQPIPAGDSENLSQEGEAEATLAIAAVKSSFQRKIHGDIAVSLLYINLKDRMEADEARVRFYPNGTSDDFTIVIESPQGIRKISLDCVTGIPDLEVLR